MFYAESENNSVTLSFAQNNSVGVFLSHTHVSKAAGSQPQVSLPMRPSSSSALLLVAAASAVLGLEVHEPTYAVGVYAETRAYFAPKGYLVNGLVTVVDACPCDWTTNSSGSYDGLILAVAEGACTEEVKCSAVEAACAAKRAEATGILLPDGFGKGGGAGGKQGARTSASIS